MAAAVDFTLYLFIYFSVCTVLIILLLLFSKRTFCLYIMTVKEQDQHKKNTVIPTFYRIISAKYSRVYEWCTSKGFTLQSPLALPLNKKESIFHMLKSCKCHFLPCNGRPL